ncbi:MAG TPA: GNAT family N-acetyltransferase, partial [Motiliproteus sp.]
MAVEELHLNLRNLTHQDYPAVRRLMDRVYDDIGGAWPEATLSKLVSDFEAGQICVEDGDEIVGLALTVRVDYTRFSNPHTYDDLIGKRMQILNQPEGDALYGLDVLIHPDYRGFRLGRRLYEARKDLCRQLNLQAVLAGGRIPGYQAHADEMTPQSYIERVGRREFYDPILSFQLSNDFQVKRVLRQYMPEDEKSQGFATLLEWSNIFYQPDTSLLNQPKTQVRVGVVQWQMREFHRVEDVLQQVEYFVDAVSDYQSDFVLFPEFFNAPLMGLTDSKQRMEAIRFLANFTARFRDEMLRMAVEYNINIITGSMPILENERLYNVSYLCHRDGSIDEQY